jgi:hypothetical protein
MVDFALTPRGPILDRPRPGNHWGIEPMRIRPIHFAVLAAGALLASPALAKDYPLPVLSASAYSETSYASDWSETGQDAGEVVYVDDLDDGEEWHSDDYRGGDYREYDDRRVETEYRDDPRPLPPPHAGEPAWGGDRPLAYGEGERQAWLAECRGRMSRDDYGVDACADYLARYESGAGGYGYDYSYGYGQTASRGCNSCGCGGGCSGGCNRGGCGCTVSYRFAPIPPMPVAQRVQSSGRRIITTEEWEEEVPGKTVRLIPPPSKTVRVKTVPVKTVPAAPRPIKQSKPQYSK